LLTAWLGLALGSLVIAGLFAILVAFTRMPAVRLLSSANLFHLALVSHVTFALTVWFAAFAGVLGVYAAWRSNYTLHPTASWAGWALAATGAGSMAVPAFTASGTPYLNDYVPVIDDPAFWVGLVATFAGVTLQASAYLAAWLSGRRQTQSGPSPTAWPSGPTREPLETFAAAVAALAMVLSLATLVVSGLSLDPAQPYALRLRALVWGAGHIYQFVHTAGMVAVWAIAAAVAMGAPSALERRRGALWMLVPPMAIAALAYLVWRPEELLANRLITWVTFAGLGGPTLPLAILLGVSIIRARSSLPWASPLFSGTALSWALFAVGGVMGVIGFNQDTRVPAHYHGMVGAVTLAYMGFTPALLELTGRHPWKPLLTRIQPYLYGLGLLGIMIGLHWAGGHGAPRKTIGFGWANAQALVAMNLMGVGSALAIAGGLAFVVNIGVPLVTRRTPRGPGVPKARP
jgi:hypothetical protein